MRSLTSCVLSCVAAVLAAAALLTAGAPTARADVIELVGGRTVQGKIVASQTTEEGLGVELFDTGGTILVKWEHIIPSRAQQLKVELGIEAPLDEEVLVPGHRVLLTNGKVMEGLALNPDAKADALQIKTRTGVSAVDRSMVSRVDEISLPGLEVYTPVELYDRIRDQDPPDSAAKHLELSKKCMQIGALDQAKEHLAAAENDSEFMNTPDGRGIPSLKRQLDLLLRSKGAQDLVIQIEGAARAKRWNDALKLLDQLDEGYKDETVRKLIHFDLLSSKVVRGRVAYFRKEVQRRVYSVMDRLIEAKAREKKPLRQDTEQRRGVATPGTLAAARQWLAKDLEPQIWEKVTADLGLELDEAQAFWKDRTGKGRSAAYGSGTFIVAKRAAPKGGSGQNPERQRRPPGSTREPQGGQNQRQVKEDKPKTEEEWWDGAGSGDKARWMTAFFAETGGVLTVVRVDESELCDSCGGKGVNVTNNTDGSTSSVVCPKCNGAQKWKKVHYR